MKFIYIFPFFHLYSLVYSFIDDYSSIDLPNNHFPFYFSNNPKVLKWCINKPNCPHKKYMLNNNKCWGYEPECNPKKRYSNPYCPGDHKGWVETKQNEMETFYMQADFGYIKQQFNELKVYCVPLFVDDSSLECSDHLRFCRGRNLMINFTDLSHMDEPIRYKMDVLKDGQIGGYCDFKKQDIDEHLDHLSPLQSWAPELRNFQQLKRRPIIEGDCDVVVDKPTFIMKIDATVNMYHHFCDFFNLYASQHLNASHFEAFSSNIQILVWESYTYKSAFSETFEAFTSNPIWDLKHVRGKTVCFRNVVLPLLPRMIFGLYYNTPIINGCEKSGLFRAFSEHVLHRLRIPFHERKDAKIRVLLISRSTRYRTIINEDELVGEIEKNTDYLVKRVVYSREMSFKTQLEITRNSDILIGMHGAGLTHLMFLPEWATLFELYNCDDSNCYKDLARLQGINYITWENMDLLGSFDDGLHKNGAHAKFANYTFVKEEFVRLVAKAANKVKNHPSFLKLHQNEHNHIEL